MRFRSLLSLSLPVVVLARGSVAAPAEPPPATAVLALDLSQCPEGAALEWSTVAADRHPFGPPNPAVDKHFAGWAAALSGWKGVPANLRVIRENGVPVLVDQPPAEGGMTGRALVGGETTWRDDAVEAPLRLIARRPIANAHGEGTTIPFAGVFARMLDLNRFYLLTLEPQRIALYRRDE